tara:strand:+ start:369 stop:2285 length:1917 start_codon:yes stop_codon:yes gene_type:complete
MQDEDQFPEGNDQTNSDTNKLLNELKKDVRVLKQQVHNLQLYISKRETKQPSDFQGEATRKPNSAYFENNQRTTPIWENFDWESIIGGNWLARIGVLAVVIGMGFFLKLVFDQNWVTQEGRIILGIVTGLAFLGISEYWKKSYPSYTQAIAGGGTGILYVSIFSSFAFYDLIGFYSALALLLLVSCTSTISAFFRESRSLAIIGIVGAFSAPLLLENFGQNVESASLYHNLEIIVYIVVLDLGVIALSTVRNWYWFRLIALTGSILIFGIWYGENEDFLNPIVAQVSLTIIFLIFVTGNTVFHLIWKKIPKTSDMTLLVFNATAYFAMSYLILQEYYSMWIGTLALALAIFYGGLAYLALKTNEQSNFSLMLLGTAIIFLVTAVPVQMGGSWVAVTWSIQGVIFIWASYKLSIWQLRVSAIILMCISVIRLIFFETAIYSLENFRIILNLRVLAFVIGIISLYLASFISIRNISESTKSSTTNPVDLPNEFFVSRLASSASILLKDFSNSIYLVHLFLITANLLTIWILSAEIITTVDSDIVKLDSQSENHIKSLSLSVLWAIYAGCLLALGMLKNWQMVRLGGLVLLVVPIVKLFLVDTFELDQGYRVVAYMSLGLIMLVGGFFYQKHRSAIKEFLF